MNSRLHRAMTAVIVVSLAQTAYFAPAMGADSASPPVDSILRVPPRPEASVPGLTERSAANRYLATFGNSKISTLLGDGPISTAAQAKMDTVLHLFGNALVVSGQLQKADAAEFLKWWDQNNNNSNFINAMSLKERSETTLGGLWFKAWGARALELERRQGKPGTARLLMEALGRTRFYQKYLDPVRGLAVGGYEFTHNAFNNSLVSALAGAYFLPKIKTYVGSATRGATDRLNSLRRLVIRRLSGDRNAEVQSILQIAERNGTPMSLEQAQATANRIDQLKLAVKPKASSEEDRFGRGGKESIELIMRAVQNGSYLQQATLAHATFDERASRIYRGLSASLERSDLAPDAARRAVAEFDRLHADAERLVQEEVTRAPTETPEQIELLRWKMENAVEQMQALMPKFNDKNEVVKMVEAMRNRELAVRQGVTAKAAFELIEYINPKAGVSGLGAQFQGLQEAFHAGTGLRIYDSQFRGSTSELHAAGGILPQFSSPTPSAIPGDNVQNEFMRLTESAAGSSVASPGAAALGAAAKLDPRSAARENASARRSIDRALEEGVK